MVCCFYMALVMWAMCYIYSIHIYIYIRVYIYIHIYIHTYTCIYIYIIIYICRYVIYCVKVRYVKNRSTTLNTVYEC